MVFCGVVSLVLESVFFTPLGMEHGKGLGDAFPLGEGNEWVLRVE